MATPEEVKKAEEVKKLAEAKKVEAAKLAEVNKVKEAEKAKEQKSPIVGRQATWAEIQNQQRGLTLDGKPRDK